MREQITRIIKNFLITDLFVDMAEDQISVDDGLQSVLGLDSIGFLELRVLCEKEFKIHITDADFTPSKFRSIRCLTDLIEGLQASKENECLVPA